MLLLLLCDTCLFNKNIPRAMMNTDTATAMMRMMNTDSPVHTSTCALSFYIRYNSSTCALDFLPLNTEHVHLTF